MPFSFKRLAIPDLILATPKVFHDTRGAFAEVYEAGVFAAEGISCPIIQINYSRSTKNVIRGLHYQKKPMGQAKIIRVLSGKIFDVALDIRKGSPTYGKWAGVELSREGGEVLYVPEGFAHGFSALTDEVEVEYFCSNPYSQEHERGIHYADKTLAIDWRVKDPILSPKDNQYPLFKEAEHDFIYKNTAKNLFLRSRADKDTA